MTSLTQTAVATGAPGRGGDSPSRPHRARRAFGRTLPLLPAMIMVAIFLLGPVIEAFYGSFTNMALTGAAAQTTEFIGFQNYIQLFQNPDFLKSVWLTILFVVGSAIIGQNVLGLALAMLMRSGHKVVSGIVGTLVVTSWVVPEVVGAFCAYAFFNGGGTLNAILGVVGLKGPDWLYVVPMVSVILANIWRGTAFSMMVYSAAITEVPEEITESAEIDGASGWKRLIYITLPMIRRSISTNLMLTTLQTLSVFGLIYIMTAGGPGTDSSTLPVLAYQEAFKFSQLGLGTAIAVVMLIIGAVFSVIYIRALKPEVD
ncbi:carbohydrate ABC transporter permease [Humibacter ginsenosidimutans]|uniref:Sugar ABC transporter permease n=1 Tax=Humibacter ginsenosidimutans TaxID=2599293 RepID=A0A5B8M4E1_9MICO|nr:sugar ABC transporter permease [Humibacter ginsenosidimutans]